MENWELTRYMAIHSFGYFTQYSKARSHHYHYLYLKVILEDRALTHLASSSTAPPTSATP